MTYVVKAGYLAPDLTIGHLISETEKTARVKERGWSGKYEERASRWFEKDILGRFDTAEKALAARDAAIAAYRAHEEDVSAAGAVYRAAKVKQQRAWLDAIEAARIAAKEEGL